MKRKGTNECIFTRKNDLGEMEYDGYKITKLLIKSDSILVPIDSQSVNYTWFQQVENISEGDYSAAFTYNSDQQRCKMVMNQNGSTLYTRWYPGSRYMKEVNGSTTTQYTWLGGDAYSAPAVSVKVGTATPVIYYVLRDYLGSITHVVKSTDLTYSEYSFDVWGRRRQAAHWDSCNISNEPALFAGRGFTGHEYLTEFGLINMNGRLYDPLLSRFLSPDNYVQNPDNTQNFNRYAYALNNPLLYTDPDGEFIFTLLAATIPGAQFLLPAAILADAAWMSNYFTQVADNYAHGLDGSNAFIKNIDWFDVGAAAAFGGAGYYAPWIRYFEPWVANAVDIKGTGDVQTIFGSNRDNPTKGFGMYLGNSFMDSGTLLITDIVQSKAKNNWGKGKPHNAPKSLADMSKKELNKMTKKELLQRAPKELFNEFVWNLSQNAFSTMGNEKFNNDYRELQLQNSNPTPYNQNMNHLPDCNKDFRKSNNSPYEILIQSLSLIK